jgi:hypothetical protein
MKLFKGIITDLLQAALTSLKPVETSKPTETKPSETTNPTGEATAPTQTTTPSGSSPPRKNESLGSFLQRELKPNAEGNFHEEQLQYGVAAYLLNEKSPALYDKFKSAYSDYAKKVGSKSSFEDGVKAALKTLVTQKDISKTDAEDINGKSFRAAQLDDDVKTLFDDKGGPDDKTIAVLSAKEAAEKVNRVYGRIRRGETAAPSRELDAASNTKVGSKTVTSAQGAGNGFLWKPISESDGKLVILAPKDISTNVSSISIYKKGSNNQKELIESGRFAGIANGDRAHYRFAKVGGSYPDGAVVEIKLKDGKVVSEVIGETSSRVG